MLILHGNSIKVCRVRALPDGLLRTNGLHLRYSLSEVQEGREMHRAESFGPARIRMYQLRGVEYVCNMGPVQKGIHISRAFRYLGGMDDFGQVWSYDHNQQCTYHFTC